jgi:hypothetical protein
MTACTHDDDNNKYLVYDDGQRKGGRIHAIVIGVGKYCPPRRRRWREGKPFDSLPGAARAAYHFARYLKKEFHEPEQRPLGTLRLLLSPVDQESDLTSLKVAQATRRRVGNALQDWADDCNTDDQNLAVLYAAGHGVALDKAVSTLFLADALEEGNEYLGAINLCLVQDYMAGCAAKDNIFVYDCCALSAEDVPTVTGAGGVFIEEFPGEGKKRQTSVFINAARVGTETFALRARGTLLTCGLLGTYTTCMGEDALLRTAGDIIEDRFGITPYQLKQDINPKLRDVLRSIKHPDETYEANITGQHPLAHIAIPQPTPKFEVVLRDVLTGRTPPVTVWFEDSTGKKWVGSDNALDGQKVPLPAGDYDAHVQSAEGTQRYKCKLVKPRELLVKHREVEVSP